MVRFENAYCFGVVMRQCRGAIIADCVTQGKPSSASQDLHCRQTPVCCRLGSFKRVSVVESFVILLSPFIDSLFFRCDAMC